MPTFIKRLRKGEGDYLYVDNLFVAKWFDRREVTILSTLHEVQMM